MKRMESVNTKNNWLVQVKDLKKHFAIKQGVFGRVAGVVKAVDGISFNIYKGETLGLVGESGSGKTTLGRVILRAVEPTAGTVLMNSTKEEITNVTTLNKRELRNYRRHMQMIFQDPYASLNPRMTVRDIIGEPLIALRIASGTDFDDRVAEAARSCRINLDYLRRYPHAFSGGERQRIGIARALVLKPEFVVCDEPVSALDVSIQAQILNLLYDLQQEHNLTYLFVAHDLSVVEHASDRIAVMYLGRIVEIASTTELFNSPLHPYTEALLSAIPAADPDSVMQPLPLKGEIPSPINPPSGCHFHPRCPYAQDVCKQTTPMLLEYQKDHFVACSLVSTLKLSGVEKSPE